MLEDSLRETFADQVQSSPGTTDLATVAIRQGRRARRRRAVASAAAAVLLFVGIAGGMLSLRDLWQDEPAATTGVLNPLLPHHDAAPEPTPTEAHRSGPPDMDLRMVNRVWTTTGEQILLTGSALVERAYHTPAGLLYGNSTEIRLRHDDGTTVTLAEQPGDWIVSPDGEQVATVAGGQARVWQLGADTLSESAGVPTDGTATPVTFWGDRVVLSGRDGVTAWDPAQAGQPAWTDQVAAVYGVAGSDLIVLTGQPDAYCVATVPDTAPTLAGAMPAADCAQHVPVTAQQPGWLAPDGAWLAVPTDDEQLLLLEVAALARGDAEPLACPYRDSVTPAWWDATTLFTADDAGAVSCDIDGTVQRRPLPERVGASWEHVITLSAAG